MNPKTIAAILGELRMLPMFPNDEAVLVGLVRLVGSMATSEAQVRWLVSRMTSGIYAQWPGPQEMRACFCSRFPPKDGINAYSTVYPDGLPPDPTLKRKELGAGEMKTLPAPDGAVFAFTDPLVEKAVDIALALSAARNVKFSAPVTKAEIAAAPDWLKKLDGYDQ